MSNGTRDDGRRMAILLRYEQVQGAVGKGLWMVAEEFGISPSRVRFIVFHERAIAVRGDRELRQSLPKKLRKRIYATPE